MIPCRILVIAPYESMKNILLLICKDRPEVRLTVMVGDLGEGARLVQEIDEEEFDIVSKALCASAGACALHTRSRASGGFEVIAYF